MCKEALVSIIETVLTMVRKRVMKVISTKYAYTEVEPSCRVTLAVELKEREGKLSTVGGALRVLD